MFQCRYRHQQKKVDSFLSASGMGFHVETGDFVCFSYRLLITTTNKWGTHAEESLHNQVPPVLLLKRNDLESARVDWDKLDEGISGAAARLEKFELRPYQKEALGAVHTHFLEHDRGKLIMACGTGKTLLSLKFDSCIVLSLSVHGKSAWSEMMTCILGF